MVARLTNGCFRVRIYCLIDSRNGRRASGVRHAECPVPGSSVTPTYGALGSVAATLSGQLSAFRLARREEAHVELLTLDAVVDPVTRGRNQFSRGDGGRMTDDRDEVSMPARFHTQYAEPSLGTVERHALRRCRREPRGGSAWQATAWPLAGLFPIRPVCGERLLGGGGLGLRPRAHGERFEAFDLAKIGAKGYRPSGCAITLRC